MPIKRRVTFNEEIIIHYYDTESNEASITPIKIKSKFSRFWLIIKKFFKF